MQQDILKKLQDFSSRPRGQAVIIGLVLFVSLVIRMLMFYKNGCGIDEGCFSAWYITAAERGIHGFYDNTWCDYPPFNVYIFWIFGKLSQAVGPDSLAFFIKFPQNLFDIAAAYMIFRFVRQWFSFRGSLAIMAVYAFNPATIFDVAVWGQMDSIYTLFMIASLYSAFRSKYELSGATLGLAILTKPQSVVLLPILAYIILRNGGWRRAIYSGITFGAVIIVVILPFRWDNPIAFLIDNYSGYSVYPFNSINAYNIWSLWSFWKPDTVAHWGLTYQQWGILGFVAFTAFVMWQLHRRYSTRAAIFAVFLLMFGFFMIMTRMHERYLFPVFALLALGWYTRYTIWIYIGLSITFFAQMVYVLSVLNSQQFIEHGHWSIYVLGPANIILLIVAAWSFYRMQRSKDPALIEDLPPPKVKWADLRRPAFIVGALCVIYFGVSVWNLGDLRAISSDWSPDREGQEVYLDLGDTTRVDKVFLLLQNADNVDLELYQGSPDNWVKQSDFSRSGVWRKWEEMHVGQDTRYIRLLFTRASGLIGEVALLSNNELLDIVGVYVDGQPGGEALIDEQDLISHPASFEEGTYFDEIYFVRAAEEQLKLEDPYGERTHPPTSKLIIGSSIWAFGYNPFAWRIAGVIAGTIIIMLMYWFARRMLNSERAGIIAAFLITFDFMHFAEARLATGEIFIFLFVICMFYFFFRYWQDHESSGKYLFLSLVFFGLGFSTKWVTMWGFAGIVLLLILLMWRRPIKRSDIYWFAGGGAAAVAIYMLSNIPYFLSGYNLTDFWNHQYGMYDFHSGLTAGHPYSSEWYTWPIMEKPLWMYVGNFGDKTGYIGTMGNPALWWVGIPAMIAMLALAAWKPVAKLFLVVREKISGTGSIAVPPLNRRNWIAIFIVIPFLTQWMIFALIGRCLFIYHYFPNVLFITLAVTIWLELLWRRFESGKWLVTGFLAVNVICFVLFFPAISGLPMSNDYWDTMRWIVDWLVGGLFSN